MSHFWPHLLAWMAGLWLWLFVAQTAAAAHAPLWLEAHQPEIDPWTSAQAWSAPLPHGDLNAAREAERNGAFRPATDWLHGNFGPQREAMWIRVPLARRSTAPADWILSIDYPSLDQVDAWLVDTRGRVTSLGRVGDTVPAAQRPLPTRSLALPLHLPPEATQELWIRVSTTSAMVVPLKLWQVQAHEAQESVTMLVQGVLTGAALCMLLYALLHAMNLGERRYGLYALTLIGQILFLLAFHGVGALHLWSNAPWLCANMAPLGALIAAGGSALFVTDVLQLRETHRWASNLLWALFGLIALSVLAFCTGLINYRAAQTLATVVGGLPMVIGLPAAWQRARSGDRTGVYFVGGWLLHAFFVLCMVGLLRGWTNATPLSLHALQVGCAIEMLSWLMVLGVQMQSHRDAAVRAERERVVMHTIAHTDALTSMLNRRGLIQGIEHRLAPVGTHAASPFAVFMLDLDGFKPVNDQWGHETGDLLLQQVALRLQAVLREGDTVARLGGDEFVVLASHLRTPDDVQRLGRKMLATFETPFVVRHLSLRIGTSIGTALYPQDGRSPEELLRQADESMYRAKAAGKGCLACGDRVVTAGPERPRLSIVR